MEQAFAGSDAKKESRCRQFRSVAQKANMRTPSSRSDNARQPGDHARPAAWPLRSAVTLEARLINAWHPHKNAERAYSCFKE
jgi:hypothetical protein